jgi:hypothetical protein
MSAEIPGQLTKQEEIIVENVRIGKTVTALSELLNEEIAKLTPRGIKRLGDEIRAYFDHYQPELSTGKKPAKPDASQPMTEAEARQFAETKITFGKYNGFLINNVPLTYLEWLTEQPDEFKRNVRRYLDSPIVRHLIDTHNQNHNLTDEGLDEDEIL